MRVRRFADGSSFLERAERWLLLHEAEHNLTLGIARRLAEGRLQCHPPLYLAVVEDDSGEIRGCAFRTPPHKLCLTRISESAIGPLVEDAAELYPDLDVVLGSEPAATRFAELWTRRRGGRVRIGMGLGIYQLDRVVPPAQPPAGRLRMADEHDLPLVLEWTAGFARDTEMPSTGAPTDVADRVTRGEIFLWDDGTPRSMTAVSGTTPNGARVGYVYTPPELRGRGFASAVVAALSQHLLDSGFRFCFLYTDLSNPTSNRIYSALGYRPVATAVDVHIDARAAGEP